MASFREWSTPQKLCWGGMLAAGTVGFLLLGSGYFWPAMASLMVMVGLVMVGLQFPSS